MKAKVNVQYYSTAERTEKNSRPAGFEPSNLVQYTCIVCNTKDYAKEYNYYVFSHLKCFVPFLRQLRPTTNRLVPDDGEVGHRGEVLGHSYGKVEVQDDVPPTTGNENRLSRRLQDLELKTQRVRKSDKGRERERERDR